MQGRCGGLGGGSKGVVSVCCLALYAADKELFDGVERGRNESDLGQLI